MNCYWRSLGALLLVLFVYSPDGAQAQIVKNGMEHCWSSPPPETIEETFNIVGNPGRRARAQRGTDRAVLLLSGGTLKAAYAAGLLVGWQETGKRPQFGAVTGVGLSALIAPFAFIGPEGDQKIADIFNCDARNLTAMAERAAALLNADVLKTIAREHEAGRRLFIALPGSGGRDEAVWDLGLLAASHDPKAAALIKRILLASVDLVSFVDPKEAPVPAGQVVKRNFTFREEGSGEPFLFPSEVARMAGKDVRTYLIHNESIIPVESANYIRTHANGGGRDDKALVPAYDVIRHSLAASGSYKVASMKAQLGMAPKGEFDMNYLKSLFLYAYRQGRMGKEWKSALPGMTP